VTTLVPCKALVAFSKYVHDYGVVHGDPDSTLDEARFPRVPVSAMDELFNAGKVEPLPSDPLDHDGDGKKGGSRADGTAAADRRKAALAKANAARAAKAAARKAAQAAGPTVPAVPPTYDAGSSDAPPVD
jgi:hypothetical protein